MQRLLAFVVLTIALCSLPWHRAVAGYAYPAPPPTWGGSAGSWTYGGSSAANADWFNGRAAANVTANVGGRAITVASEMRVAANAAQYVARRAVLNPWVAGAATAAWLALSLWEWNEATQAWQMPPGTRYGFTVFPFNSGLVYTSSEAACGAGVLEVTRRESPPFRPAYYQFTLGAVDTSNGRCGFEYTYRTESGDVINAQGSIDISSGEVSPVLDVGDADDHAAAHPIPDAVLREVDDLLPLPVEVPRLAPSSTNLGAPRTAADGSRVQDRAVLTPANDALNPWRVDARIETVPEGTPESTPGPEAEPEPQREFCELNPSSIVCADMDVPEAPELPNQNINVAISPAGGFGADNAACPSARHLTVAGRDVPIPFDMFCQYFGMLRYLVIGFAWLTAGFILLGRVE